MSFFSDLFKKISLGLNSNLLKNSIFANEEKYRRLVELSPDAIIVSDLAAKIQVANNQAARLFGFTSPAEMVGKSSFDLIAPEEQEKAKKKLTQILVDGKFSNLEYIAVRRDKSRIFISVSAAVIRDKQGKPQGLIGIARDVTFDKQLKESKSFTASIVDSADDAIIGETLDGKITSWNRGAEKLYGYKQNEALGQSMSIIFPPELKDELTKILEKLRRGEHFDHYETVRMDRTGRRIPVSITISPVVDDRGKIIGASSITRDITKEKELDRLKDEFISLTSHALRTPLSAIKGLISMIHQGDYGPMNKNLEKPLGNISISTERLIHLVNDLLNISKVKTGKLEFILTSISLNKSVEKVVRLLMPIAKEHGLDLLFTDSKMPNVQGDIEKTEDILNNLLSNALKFTNKGSVKISLKEEGDHVWVVVEDSGIGISEKDKFKLFKRFEQIANPTSKQITGTGLGLYLSKMLAEKMGGEVWLVQSEVKKGSSFAFSLPRADSKLAEEVKLSFIKKNK